MPQTNKIRISGSRITQSPVPLKLPRRFQHAANVEKCWKVWGGGVRAYEKYKVKGSVQVWEGHKHSCNTSRERVDQWRDPMWKQDLEFGGL